ncbi:MAG: sugar phosphate isomerase/epimerase, partial [Dictyoglomus sp.]
MEMVWSTSNLVSLGLEEDISLAIEYSKFILLDYKKVMDYLKINPLDTLKKFLKEKEIVPLLISHEYRLGLSEPTKNENIMKIYELTKELDIPFLLINPEVKPENLSFNV